MEIFNGNITLDFDPDFSDPDGHDNLRMSVQFRSKRSETDNKVTLYDTSNDADQFPNDRTEYLDSDADDIGDNAITVLVLVKQIN